MVCSSSFCQGHSGNAVEHDTATENLQLFCRLRLIDSFVRVAFKAMQELLTRRVMALAVFLFFTRNGLTQRWRSKPHEIAMPIAFYCSDKMINGFGKKRNWKCGSFGHNIVAHFSLKPQSHDQLTSGENSTFSSGVNCWSDKNIFTSLPHFLYSFYIFLSSTFGWQRKTC